MNIKLRKQYSKGYQVYEIELDGVPQEKIEGANAWMDRIGIAEVNKMADAVPPEVTQAKPVYNKPTYTKPAYNNTPRPSVTSGKPASPKQIEWLDKYNVAYNPATITSAEASKLLDAVFKNDKKETKSAPAVAKQEPVGNPYEEMGTIVTNDQMGDGLPF